MKGKTVVATGATSGIGEAAVLALASMGARIVLVTRDERRAEATLNALEARGPRLGHSVHMADLSSMAETRRVGSAIAASEPRIDVLINNAGAMFSVRQLTAEGLERTFALNHMAYFMLTVALGDRLEASTPARIVSTASAAHREPEDTVGSRPTGARNSPTSCLPPNSSVVSPGPASPQTAFIPALSPPVSAARPAAGLDGWRRSLRGSRSPQNRAPTPSSASPRRQRSRT